MPAQIIDKGIPTSGLLAQVLIAKYADHLPLYRQEQIFTRAGVALPRSTLAEWIGVCGVQLQPLVDALRDTLLKEAVLHADETPVPMPPPGKKKTHKAYIWAYTSTPFSDLNAVIYHFTPGRSGQHARDMLGEWSGKLVCDDYSGYKASSAKGSPRSVVWPMPSASSWNWRSAVKVRSPARLVEYIRQLYEIEREAAPLSSEVRHKVRQSR